MAYTDRNSDGEYELSIFDKKGNKTKIADGVTKAIREEDGDIVYDSRHDLMLYQKEESERIGIGIVDFWYADEMKRNRISGWTGEKRSLLPIVESRVAVSLQSKRVQKIWKIILGLYSEVKIR